MLFGFSPKFEPPCQETKGFKALQKRRVCSNAFCVQRVQPNAAGSREGSAAASAEAAAPGKSSVPEPAQGRGTLPVTCGGSSQEPLANDPPPNQQGGRGDFPGRDTLPRSLRSLPNRPCRRCRIPAAQQRFLNSAFVVRFRINIIFETVSPGTHPTGSPL